MTNRDSLEATLLDDAVQMKGRHQVRVDRSRDALLTDFGRATLDDRYLLPGEGYQDLFARVASFYGDDAAHAQRLYDYISRMWLMPATPVLSNGGTQRGLPISCFLNEASDSLDGIVGLWNENVWLASKGGGIGSYWGNLRSIGEKVGQNGKTSGVIPFIRVMDSLTLAISQGSLRRGSAAVYLPGGAPRNRGIHRDQAAPPAATRTARRRTCITAFWSPTILCARWRATSCGRCVRRRTTSVVRQISARCALDPHPDRACGDGRALPGVLRPREQRASGPPQAGGAGGEDLESLQRNHAADRASISMAGSAPPSAACPPSTSRRGSTGRTTRCSSRTRCGSSTTCCRISSIAPRRRWSAQNMRRCASVP